MADTEAGGGDAPPADPAPPAAEEEDAQPAAPAGDEAAAPEEPAAEEPAAAAEGAAEPAAEEDATAVGDEGDAEIQAPPPKKGKFWAPFSSHASGRRLAGAVMRTVLPAPLRPTIRVRGLGNTIAWSFSGLKLRMPLIRSFSTLHMVARAQI